MSQIDLNELEKKAQAATPGVWTNKCKKHIDYHVDAQVHLEEHCKAPAETHCDHVKEVARDCTETDSAFIAACSPDTILGLVARVLEADAIKTYLLGACQQTCVGRDAYRGRLRHVANCPAYDLGLIEEQNPPSEPRDG